MNEQQALHHWQNEIPERDIAYLAIHDINGALDRIEELLKTRHGVGQVRMELPGLEKLEDRIQRLVNNVHPLTAWAAE